MVVSHIAESKNVRLVPPRLKDEDARLLSSINADKFRFQQILVNLLSNSLKFSNKDSEVRVILKVLETQESRDLFAHSFTIKR